MDPLSSPKVGSDRTPPLSIPDTDAVRIPVDDRTYIINNTSEGSIEPTRNIHYPANGDSPAGCEPEYVSNKPDTSAALFTVGELKNFIVGLSKIDDINLFYGRDEKAGAAFRDPSGIDELLSKAEKDKLHEECNFEYSFAIEDKNLVMKYSGDLPDVFIEGKDLYFRYTDEEGTPTLTKIYFDQESGNLYLENASEIIASRIDPNGGQVLDKNPDYPVRDYEIILPVENDMYVLPSGEFDGEELKSYEGLGPNNFFDDYGAQPGDGNYHPFNKSTTPVTRRDIIVQDDRRKIKRIPVVQGGRRSSEFGANPRNPAQGNEYKGYPVYKGSESTCNNVCTGLCSTTCDDFCSESCTQTCTMRCGNACTSSCGNACTGCSSQCYNTCKTKCENNEGYACVKSGAKTMDVEIVDGQVVMHTTTYSCTGCSYSCQFYPNKKTTCWDAGCMGKCFTSCESSCSDSCLGGCIGNDNENTGDYKIGKGAGCSSHCTMNCIGACKGVCEGQCTTTCWHACKEQCYDNCEFSCSTDCGSGCMQSCTNGCKGGCFETCESGCKGETDQIACMNCGSGCTTECTYDCNTNCFNRGCNAICGVNTGGACSANCKMNCSASSCTAECSDACSDQCTTCVNTCGFECGGSCSAQCGESCDDACRYKCTATCEHTCDLNCVKSCTEECGACSSLCFSCVGMCIGVCSVKCENGCSTCTNSCGYWCDNECNQACFSNCETYCLKSCTDNCSTHLYSETTHTQGPERNPTAYGYIYPEPVNREQEALSFQLLLREDVVIVDPFHFFIEGRNLCLTMDDGTVVHLVIDDEGYLVLYEDYHSTDEYILSKYRFTILEDQTLEIDKNPLRFVDPLHFRIDGNDLYITPRDGVEIHLVIDEDGYLDLSPDEDSYVDWLLSKYTFTINDDGYLILEMAIGG